MYLESLVVHEENLNLQAPVVQSLDSAIHWLNLYPVDNASGFPNTYLLDSDLSGGYRYPTFEQLGPVKFEKYLNENFSCMYTVYKSFLQVVVSTNLLSNFLHSICPRTDSA